MIKKDKMIMGKAEFIENGSVTSVPGFLAAGVTAGFKKSGTPDFALVYSETPAAFSGDFSDRRLQKFHLSQISGNDHAPGIPFHKLPGFRQFFQIIAAQQYREHLLLSQFTGNSSADTAAGSGDHGDPVLQGIIHKKSFYLLMVYC
jgi:hypothetical protein